MQRTRIDRCLLGQRGQIHRQGRNEMRITLWHCLSFLGGDAHCIEKANRMILAEYKEAPCHFSPGAAVEVLMEHRARLTPEVIERLERYLRLNLPYMSTEDLKIRGGNDNHPFKACMP